MVIYINHRETLFNQSNLTPIGGKPTSEIPHKLQNKIKANDKSVYSNIRGGAHGHIGLVLIDANMRSFLIHHSSIRITWVHSSFMMAPPLT